MTAVFDKYAPFISRAPILSSSTFARLAASADTSVPHPRGDAVEQAVRIETELFLMLAAEPSSYQLRVARTLVLKNAGWSAPEIGKCAGVSRMTVSNWLSYVVADAGHGPKDPLTLPDTVWDHPGVVSPVLDRRSLNRLATVESLRVAGMRGQVPEELVGPLTAMWRVAVRQKNPLTVAVVNELPFESHTPTSDALDLTLLLLIRRGVTMSNIAKTTGLTHRGVLDRVLRARQRGRLLDPSEEYLGEFELCSADRRYLPDRWLGISSAFDPMYAHETTRWVAVAPVPLSPTAEPDGCDITPNLMFSTVSKLGTPQAIVLTRDEWAEQSETLSSLLELVPHMTSLTPDQLHEPTRWLSHEPEVIDRLVLSSHRPPHGTKTGITFVPEHLLYLSGRIDPSVRIKPDGSVNPDIVIPSYVPAAYLPLFEDPLTRRCFFDVEGVKAENPRPKLHKPDAKTRRANRTFKLPAENIEQVEVPV